MDVHITSKRRQHVSKVSCLHTLVGLEGYGLAVVERVSIEIASTPENEKYLRAKKERMGHLIDMDK